MRFSFFLQFTASPTTPNSFLSFCIKIGRHHFSLFRFSSNRFKSFSLLLYRFSNVKLPFPINKRLKFLISQSTLLKIQ